MEQNAEQNAERNAEQNKWIHIVGNLKMPEQMQENILINCRERKRVNNFVFRYSKAIAEAIITILLVTVSTTSYAAVNIYQEKNISVFFEEGISDARVEEIGDELWKIQGISDVCFESAEDAWDSFKSEYLSKELAEQFTDNPLRDSFNYTMKIALDADTQKVRAQIMELEGVRLVVDLKEEKRMGMK